jgi:uncharacterized membrane protein YoaK (UPF0700 family)
MISKIPRWGKIGAAVLAFSAGMINAVALLDTSHQATTHMTGIVSHLAISLIEKNISMMGLLFGVACAFFLGALICGLIIRDSNFQRGRRYGYALALESLLLLFSTYGFVVGSVWGAFLASMAAGLQNAMVSHYSGAIIRTTHMTGILTDLGVLVGHKLRGSHVDSLRIKLFSIILISFFLGGCVGGVLYFCVKGYAMLAPTFVIAVMALAYERIKNKTDDIIRP